MACTFIIIEVLYASQYFSGTYKSATPSLRNHDIYLSGDVGCLHLIQAQLASQVYVKSQLMITLTCDANLLKFIVASFAACRSSSRRLFDLMIVYQHCF